MWRILKYIHMTDVEKFHIPPHHVEKSEMSLHDRFFSAYPICDICDKYQVWTRDRQNIIDWTRKFIKSRIVIGAEGDLASVAQGWQWSLWGQGWGTMGAQCRDSIAPALNDPTYRVYRHTLCWWSTRRPQTSIDLYHQQSSFCVYNLYEGTTLFKNIARIVKLPKKGLIERRAWLVLVQI